MNAQEHYKTEKEIQDELTDTYGIVNIAGMEFDSGRILREFDDPFFNATLAESLQWECDNCGELFDENDKESAENCCQDEEESDDEEYKVDEEEEEKHKQENMTE